MNETSVVGEFRKSGTSQTADQCVEVAPLSDGGRAVRDSKNPTGGTLRFTPGEWGAFTAGVKVGEFDL